MAKKADQTFNMKSYQNDKFFPYFGTFSTQLLSLKMDVIQLILYEIPFLMNRRCLQSLFQLFKSIP